MGEDRFTLVSDDSGHDYVIPAQHRDDWYQGVGDDDGNLPEWAVEVDTPRLTFTNWKEE